jgi:hypothetical protein
MSKLEGIRWFKTQFVGSISTGIRNTPFTLNLLSAIAVQESYSDAWGLLYTSTPVADVLKRCVGDSLDYPSRSGTAFPKNRGALEAMTKPNGKRMFTIARAALVDLAQYSKGYKKAAKNQDKFCHAFGIFQYDIQFFPTNPDFFLQQRWANFGDCLSLCLAELGSVLKTLYGANKNTLSLEEMVYVAIGYNIGAKKVKVGKGFDQGFRDGDGTYYGQNIWDNLHLAQAVPDPGS